jgi:hypothetical protein
VVDQLKAKVVVGAVIIKSVYENIPGTWLMTGLCQLQSIHVVTFLTTFYGALIPALLGMRLEDFMFLKLFYFWDIF